MAPTIVPSQKEERKKKEKERPPNTSSGIAEHRFLPHLVPPCQISVLQLSVISRAIT